MCHCVNRVYRLPHFAIHHARRLDFRRRIRRIVFLGIKFIPAADVVWRYRDKARELKNDVRQNAELAARLRAETLAPADFVRLERDALPAPATQRQYHDDFDSVEGRRCI